MLLRCKLLAEHLGYVHHSQNNVIWVTSTSLFHNKNCVRQEHFTLYSNLVTQKSDILLNSNAQTFIFVSTYRSCSKKGSVLYFIYICKQSKVKLSKHDWFDTSTVLCAATPGM